MTRRMELGDFPVSLAASRTVRNGDMVEVGKDRPSLPLWCRLASASGSVPESGCRRRFREGHGRVSGVISSACDNGRAASGGSVLGNLSEVSAQCFTHDRHPAAKRDTGSFSEEMPWQSGGRI